ncbi:MAG: hypothetical protein ACUVWP_07740 [bacterium]
MNVDRPGVIEMNIDTKELSNGVYIIEMVTEGFIATKNFVIVR